MKINDRNRNRNPIRFTDADGIACVRIPLARGKGVAELWAADFDRLVAACISYLWSLNANGQGRWYVKARTANNTRVVARLILKAAAGEYVEHRDGNPLNLRRDNLRLRRGGAATVDCVELLSQSQEVQA